MKLVHDNSEEAVTKNDCQNVVNIFKSNINEWDVEGAVPYNGLLSREYNPPPLAVKVKGGGFFLVKHTVFGGLLSCGIVTMLSPPYHSPMLSNKCRCEMFSATLIITLS